VGDISIDDEMFNAARRLHHEKDDTRSHAEAAVEFSGEKTLRIQQPERERRL
jgi:hypothetical protein